MIRRACEFAIGKPAREILYTVVSRQERYKAKNFIDTVVSRGSDVVSTWSHAGLRGLGMHLWFQRLKGHLADGQPA